MSVRGVRIAKGYTLLELLVVMAILSTIATLAVPIAGNLVEGVKLQTDARSLIVTLRSLRDEAVNKQQEIAIENDEKTSGLATEPGGPLALPDGSIAKISGDNGTLIFFPDGTSGGGEIRVSRNGEDIDIRVSWLLGDIGLDQSK